MTADALSFASISLISVTKVAVVQNKSANFRICNSISNEKDRFVTFLWTLNNPETEIGASKHAILNWDFFLRSTKGMIVKRSHSSYSSLTLLGLFHQHGTSKHARLHFAITNEYILNMDGVVRAQPRKSTLCRWY